MSDDSPNTKSDRFDKLRQFGLIMGILAGRLFLPLIFALLFATALAPILYIAPDHLERNVTEDEQKTPLQRLALVVMQSAGLIVPNPNFGESNQDGDKDNIEWAIMSSPIERCAFDRITRVLVAVESYVRPEWRRRLEIAIAHLIYDITGNFPNWTFGIGQIRLDTARHAMQTAMDRIEPVFGTQYNRLPTEEELFNLLEDECSNVSIAQLIMLQSTADTPTEAAKVYRGGKSNLAVPGVVSYESLVTELATMDMPMTTGGIFNVFMKDELSCEEKDWKFSVSEFPAETVVDETWPVVCLDRRSDCKVHLMIPESHQDGSKPNNLASIKEKYEEMPILKIEQKQFELTLVYTSFRYAYTPLRHYAPEDHSRSDKNREIINVIDPYIMGLQIKRLDKLKSLGIDTPGNWQRISSIERKEFNRFACREMVMVSPRPTTFYEYIAAGSISSK